MILRPSQPAFTGLSSAFSCFNITSQCRTFTSSSTLCARSTKNALAHEHSQIPPYPFGPSQWFKQSNHGLYGGARKQYGNNVSQKTEIKTRRYWKLNMQYKRLFSIALNRAIRVRVSTRVLRTIDKVGGLDEYLLGEKKGRVRELGMKGWALRWRIMQTPSVRKRFAHERALLGLTEGGEEGALESIDEALAEGTWVNVDGSEPSAEQVSQEVRRFDEVLDEDDRREKFVEADEAIAVQGGASEEVLRQGETAGRKDTTQLLGEKTERARPIAP